MIYTKKILNISNGPKSPILDYYLPWTLFNISEKLKSKLDDLRFFMAEEMYE